MSEEFKHQHGINERVIDTVLADDIEFFGSIEGSKTLLIKGKVEGKINLSDELFIGKESEIIAECKLESLTLEGKLEGNIEASNTVSLRKGAFLKGDIKAKEIEIQKGVKFNGICKMD